MIYICFVASKERHFISHKTESFGALNSLKQFELELLSGSILGEVEQVEAGVGHG